MGGLKDQKEIAALEEQLVELGTRLDKSSQSKEQQLQKLERELSSCWQQTKEMTDQLSCVQLENSHQEAQISDLTAVLGELKGLRASDTEELAKLQAAMRIFEGNDPEMKHLRVEVQRLQEELEKVVEWHEERQNALAITHWASCRMRIVIETVSDCARWVAMEASAQHVLSTILFVQQARAWRKWQKYMAFRQEAASFKFFILKSWLQGLHALQ